VAIECEAYPEMKSPVWSLHRWCSFVPAALLACACTAVIAPTQSASGNPAFEFVISDVSVLSPERAAPLVHGHVRIRDGRILEVSDKPLEGGQKINGTGRYLIPGLIDSHVHLAISPGFPAAMTSADAAAHPDIVAEALAQDPKSFLYFGFTTVLDLVGSGDRIARWNALELRPDAHFCGAAVIVNHQTRHIPFPAFSYAESGAAFAAALVSTSEEAPDAVIGRIAGDGAICVKTMYDGFARVVPSVSELQALVAAAHARDLPVFIHANRREGQAVAVAAGVDVMAHGMWRNQNEPPELDEEARGILADVVRNGMGYQPTTQVIVGEFDALDRAYLTRSVLANVYPARLIEWLASVQDKNPVRARLSYTGAEARLQGTIRRGAEVTRFLADRNGRLLFGSDTPSAELHTNPPGLNGRLEMNNWIAARVSNAQLFRAMTIDNARAMGLDDEIGTIEAGKKANLLLLGADPLENVKAYDAIEIVFLNGRPITRETLSARQATAARP
jgi:imidazolonepropionase-like amidohydrolase